MRFQLSFACDNAAFEDDAYGRSHEVRRMLRQVERDMFESIDERHEVDPGQEHRLRDANGNTVGTWAFIADAPAFEACNSCPWPSQCAERGSCEAGQ